MYIDDEAAIEIYYYMIAVDGEVRQAEMEKYVEIAKETLDFDSNEKDEENEFREALDDEFIKKYNERLERAIDEEEHFEIIKERIDELASKSVWEWDSYGSIEVSRLLWNLLSIAASDKEYSAIEQKLIRYIVRKLNIDKNIYLEMENAMKAIQDVNRETDLLKQSNKSYAAIESMINVLSERQNVIFGSVKELIADDREE